MLSLNFQVDSWIKVSMSLDVSHLGICSKKPKMQDTGDQIKFCTPVSESRLHFRLWHELLREPHLGDIQATLD